MSRIEVIKSRLSQVRNEQNLHKKINMFTRELEEVLDLVEHFQGEIDYCVGEVDSLNFDVGDLKDTVEFNYSN